MLSLSIKLEYEQDDPSTIPTRTFLLDLLLQNDVFLELDLQFLK